MQNRIIQFTLLLLLGAGLSTFTACGSSGEGGGHSQGEEQVDGDHGDGAVTTTKSKYMCPMECEGSDSEEAGECPVCGMDLVLRSEWEKVQNEERGADHGHDHSHEGHDHEGHDHEGHIH